jgi:hypothetical protein
MPFLAVCGVVVLVLVAWRLFRLWKEEQQTTALAPVRAIPVTSVPKARTAEEIAVAVPRA